MDVPSVDAVREQLEAAAPPGPLYRPRGEGTFHELREALAARGVEFREAMRVLVDEELDPARASALLVEWERRFGLPDPELPAPASPTFAQRRAAVLGKLRAVGGQAPAYFVDVAAALGYVVTIVEGFDGYPVARAGSLRAGDHLWGPAWAYHWEIHGPSNTIRRARAGSLRAGERLATWDNTLLETSLRRLKPAHTTLGFVYT